MKFFQVTNLVIFFFLIAGVTNSLWFFLGQVDNWEIFPTLYFGVSRWEFLFSFNSVDLQTHFFEFVKVFKVLNFSSWCIGKSKITPLTVCLYISLSMYCLPIFLRFCVFVCLSAGLSFYLPVC